ncbi:MAG: hypothetical protein P8M22_11680 [Phycisphaerales bacterium]|nr:hypothetical protein [Phycisphaerales bacterium]
MNVKRASIFAGAVAGLAISSMATAGFEGMAFEIVRDGAEGRTYRLYAMLADGDRLDAVAGNGSQGLNLTSVNGFYQDGAGGATSLAINSNFFKFVPSMEWDSYVTVGALYADGTPFGSNGMNDVGMDFTNFENGGDLSTSNGTWFVTPDLDQGNAIMHDNLGANGGDMGYGVLIAQVTTTTTGGVDGTFSGLLQGKDAAGDTWQANVDGFEYGGVPAPGALALLGLAGIAGRRRRRA